MKIGILSAAGNVFPIIRANPLIQRGHKVYYLGVLPGFDDPNFTVGGFEYVTIKPRVDKPFLLRQLDIAFQARSLCNQLDLDILHVIDMAFCLCAPISRRVVTVIENNGSDILVAPRNIWYLPYLYSYCYKYCDAVIQDSQIVQQTALSLGAPQRHNEVIELGIDFDVFNLGVRKNYVRNLYNLNPSQKIVFSPRNYLSLYNIDIIIKSIALVNKSRNDVVYIFSGSYPGIESELKAFTRSLHIENCTIFVGMLDRIRELPYFYADSDIVVSVPSSDSMPGSVLEAMACGARTIISELPWYHDKFKNYVDLVTVPVGDHDSLAKAIMALLEGNPNIDKQAVFEKVKSRYDVSITGPKLENLYIKLISEKNQF